MKFRLVEDIDEDIDLEEDILTENDWYTVPFTDNLGNSDEVSFYTSSGHRARSLFNQLIKCTPDERHNYLSKGKSQKFDPLTALMLSGGTYTLGCVYKPRGTPVNKVTIEDKSLRTNTKNYLYNKYGISKSTLTHHKDGNEDNNDDENLVTIDSGNNWLNGVFHKLLSNIRFDTTSSSPRKTVLPYSIPITIYEYSSVHGVVTHTATIEIK